MRTLTYHQIWNHAHTTGYPKTLKGWTQALHDLIDATPLATTLIDQGTGTWTRHHHPHITAPESTHSQDPGPDRKS